MSRDKDGRGDHHGRREVMVTHVFTTDVDTDRLDEWVDANFPDGSVQIMDIGSREVLYDSL